METIEGLMTIKGSIATFVADNLGSHAVGGFKEGGSALRPCRHCMVVNPELRMQVNTNDVKNCLSCSYNILFVYTCLYACFYLTVNRKRLKASFTP